MKCYEPSWMVIFLYIYWQMNNMKSRIQTKILNLKKYLVRNQPFLVFSPFNFFLTLFLSNYLLFTSLLSLKRCRQEFRIYAERRERFQTLRWRRSSLTVENSKRRLHTNGLWSWRFQFWCSILNRNQEEYEQEIHGCLCQTHSTFFLQDIIGVGNVLWMYSYRRWSRKKHLPKMCVIRTRQYDISKYYQKLMQK